MDELSQDERDCVLGLLRDYCEGRERCDGDNYTYCSFRLDCANYGKKFKGFAIKKDDDDEVEMLEHMASFFV